MTKKDTKDDIAEKKAKVTKKLESERNKYFVPQYADLGEIEADSLEDLETKLKERQEDK